MKWIALIAGALVIGYLLGGWSPRAANRRLEAKVDHLQRVRKNQAVQAKPSIQGITQMLNVPAQSNETAAATAPPEPASSEPAEGATNETAAVEEPAAEEPVPAPETMEEHIEKAAEIWGMRADIARDAFIAEINANDDEAMRFDVLVDAMNLRLETSIEKWADILAGDAMPPREAAIRMMHEISEALVITHDELDRSMPIGWERSTEKDIQLVDFIDPRVALPLTSVEDKLDFD